jgi:hypothetical protein
LHIAIDDTYGPSASTASKYVTGNRRTHVAVVFPDKAVEYYREQIRDCLSEIRKKVSKNVKEFHFVDIYNRASPWDELPNEGNLRIVEFFAYIYTQHKWPVMIQTVDNRTLRDHGIEKIIGYIEGLNLLNKADLSLLWLLIRIKRNYRNSPEPIRLILDEGKRKAGMEFGSKIFHDWPLEFSGHYAASSQEPLLQIVDFVAFCINRSTHLAMKSRRTDVDNWFLGLVGSMEIKCEDLQLAVLPSDFSVADFDALHRWDRRKKGLSKL